ncbi:MAG: hypothetical protein KAI47_08070 [Deltaproteobacteria bacterium]|nr:hypothetical protein [Deltaproteobacteria bacterium]
MSFRSLCVLASVVLFAAVLFVAGGACSGGEGATDAVGPREGVSRDGLVSRDGALDGARDAGAGEGRDGPSGHAEMGPDVRAGDTMLAKDLPLSAEATVYDLRPADTVANPDSNGNPELQVLILAGQSNMVGLGYTKLLSAADRASVPNAYIYYDDGPHPNTNTQKWMPLQSGFGVANDRFGPEVGFGHRLRTLWPQGAFAIIKVAVGGTAIKDRWAARKGDLYKLLIATVKAQMASLHKTWQPRLVGFVWMQGESDGTNHSAAAAYKGRLDTFITDVRQDLSAPALPFVAGLISPHAGWPYANLVRDGTAALRAPQQPMEVVEAADLPRDPADTVHYDTNGSLALGRRFAEAIAAIYANAWHEKDDFGANAYSYGWSYRYRLGTTAKAMTYDLKQDRWGGPEAALLIGPGWMHPGPTSSAEVVWRARRLGLMQVKVHAEAGDNTGGDGTWVEIAKDQKLFWGPKAVPNNGKADHAFQVLMHQGEELRFRTSAGPAKDNSHDTTVWSIDVTFAGP